MNQPHIAALSLTALAVVVVLTYAKVSAVPIADICGNGLLEGTEQCDDGNLLSGDGCSAICEIEVPVSICGNAVIEAGEACDDGNTVTETCVYGETACTVCDATCQSVPGVIPYCGDNLMTTPEQCDDGNKISGDGCSCTCKTEVCGDNKQDVNEQCDDGNTISGDGCSTTCMVEQCQKGAKNCTEKKITICHMPPGNPTNIQEISIGLSALQAHLDHGDVLGGCGNLCR